MPGTVSAFFDESGQEKEYQPDTKYYLLTMVLHDQSRPIAEHISRYESCLAAASLPGIPFHAYDLFHRQKGYEGLAYCALGRA